MQQLNSTIQILLARFNGQVLIPFIDAVQCAGIKEHTARNKLSKDQFPIPTVWDGARRKIHVRELAAYIDGLSGVTKPKRGRPTKASKLGRVE